jgi:methylmalonyl-CoA/ethylmalonyl-CoA epimerase
MAGVLRRSDLVRERGMSDSMEAAVQRIDHIAIALPDMAEAVPLLMDTLGGRFISGGDNDETGIRLAHLAFPGLKVELLQPLRSDSLVAESLRRNGPGFHHLTFIVDDVMATERGLRARGWTTTGTDVSSPAWSETFIRPRFTFGALMQFVSTNKDWHVPTDKYNVDDVLAGRLVWRNHVACLRDAAGQAVEHHTTARPPRDLKEQR